MLRWRLILGVVFVALLAGLCWLDARSAEAGRVLAILALIVAGLAGGELRRMYRQRGVLLTQSVAYRAAILPVLFSSIPVLFPMLQFNAALGSVGWLGLGLVIALIDAMTEEMWRYEEPGQATANVAHAALSAGYVGGLVGMLVQLRIVMAPGDATGWHGLAPLLSVIATVKLSDIGQYAVGRTLGRHKLAPRLSPGKTWEGALGGILLASLAAAAWLSMYWRQAESFSAMYFFKAWLFGLTVSIVGLIGDLAESMLKRDAGVKDSSDWLPGFGGVLDLLDSILFAAPVGYLWWVTGLLES